MEGGNHRVPQSLLKESGANVIMNRVMKLTNITTNSSQPLYRLETSDGIKEYDVVVIACPLIKGKSTLQFSGFTNDLSTLGRPYHHLYVYIVEGVPNYKHFGYETLEAMPQTIFPIGPDSFYNSLSELSPVTDTPSKQHVYKVFANNKLNQEQLDLLFSYRKSLEIIEWNAYPEYSAEDTEFTQFVIGPQLYYVNAIEMAASAMEMSAISGYNVANLVVHEWMQHDHLINNMFIIEEKHIKIEL